MQIIGGTPLLAFVVEGPRCRAHKGGSDLPCFVVFPCQESCASFTERTSSPSGRPAAGGGVRGLAEWAHCAAPLPPCDPATSVGGMCVVLCSGQGSEVRGHWAWR